MSKSSKKIFGMNIGSSSMLLIFIGLCLVSFAALSIVSANADKRLSQKIADRTTAYYEACNDAEKSLAGIDQVLREQYNSSADREAYFQAVGHSKAYAIPISDTQTLYVEIEILYPESANDTFYELKTWKVITE